MPFLPYSGLMDRLIERFSAPVVLARMDLLIDGVLMPNFIATPPQPVQTYRLIFTPVPYPVRICTLGSLSKS
jgi:hypothetical protein